MTAKEERILAKLRPICLALPDTIETVTFGHPTFRAGKKTFAVLETYQGHLSLALKVRKADQGIFLNDPRFYRTPYIGQHGWVSLKVGGKVNWTEVKHLVVDSFRLTASKKMLAVMESNHAKSAGIKPERNLR